MSRSGLKELGLTEVDAPTVRDWLERDEIVLVDVRETTEYEIEHIPGSVLCPMSVFDPDIFPRIPKKRVVLMCAIGKRSAAAALQLHQTGHKMVSNLEGGIEAWKMAGCPTEVEFVPPTGAKDLPLLSKDTPAIGNEAVDAHWQMAPTRAPNVHPGEVLFEEFLKPLNLSQKRLAGDIKVSPGAIGNIVHGKRPVSPTMALRLARYFCTADDFWLRLQADHDLEKARQVSGKKIDKEVKPRKPRS